MGSSLNVPKPRGGGEARLRTVLSIMAALAGTALTISAAVLIFLTVSGLASLLFGWDVRRFIITFAYPLFLDMPRYFITDGVVISHYLYERRMVSRELVAPQPIYMPFVSIIIPALNAERTIKHTVESLLETTYKRKEIIVVDDGSTDRTYEILYPYARAGLIKLFRKKERGGKAAALNLGVRMSRGEIIIPVDSDTIVKRDAIDRVIAHMANEQVGAVSCNIKVRNYRDSLLTRLQYCEYMQTIQVGRRFLSLTRTLTIVAGAFGAYRKQIVESMGSWDPGIGDDSDMTLKTRKTRRRVIFAPDAIAYTGAPTTLRKFFRQRRRWEKNFIRNRFRKHGDILNFRVYGVSNPVAILLSFFYRGVLLFGYFGYLIVAAAANPQVLLPILFLSYIFYTLLSLFSLTISASLSPEKATDFKHVIFAPLMPFYRTLLRIPRTIAYIEEFLGIRYEDPFYPPEVWRVAPRYRFNKTVGAVVVLFFVASFFTAIILTRVVATLLA